VEQPFITPSLFDATGDNRIVDEWTFCQFQDRAKAAAVLQHHWDTFIIETDFAEIAGAGYVLFGPVFFFCRRINMKGLLQAEPRPHPHWILGFRRFWWRTFHPGTIAIPFQGS